MNTSNSKLLTPKPQPTYPIADTHTHLYFSAFDADQDQVIKTCDNTNVQMQVQIGCDEVSTVAALTLAQKYPHFYSTVGVHPCDVLTCFDAKKDYRPSGFEDYQLRATDFDALFSLFDDLIRKNPKKIVGIGETGFDLYHNNSDEIFDVQKDVFLRHIELAKKHDKPLVIHIRNAIDEFFTFAESGILEGVRAVVHCFSEDREVAQRLVEQSGFFLGIGGVATYPNSKSIREAIRQTPIEFLLTETDSPFLVPHKTRKRGIQRNDASNIPEVIQLLAELKGIDVVECGEILFANAKRFYEIC